MFVKIVDGRVDVFPYGPDVLRRDNPQTSFPDVMSNELLESFGVYPVSQLEIPSDFDNINQNAAPAAPILVDGSWVQGWDISSASPEELAQRLSDLAQNARATRDGLLNSSDWTQLPDAPVDASVWAEYRSSLRDITTQSSFPVTIVWPVKP
jgi:hypothetical protein